MKLSDMDRNTQFRLSLNFVYTQRGFLADGQHIKNFCCFSFVFLAWISKFQLAGIYKNVIGTDTSAEQLSFAEELPNIRYQQTAPAMTIDELKANVAPHQSLDLVTVAQAFHWFDRPTFYQQVKCLLKRPNGVLAVWCYTLPQINDSIDVILGRLHAESDPFWARPRKIVDDEYRNFEFPFEPVEGTEHTGPFEFEAKQSMDLDAYLTFIRSGSAYQTARQKGFVLGILRLIQSTHEHNGYQDLRGKPFKPRREKPRKRETIIHYNKRVTEIHIEYLTRILRMPHTHPK